MNHNVHFEFIGFEPEYEMRNFITSVADRIHSLAPSDSFMKVAMKKGRDVVEASCRIASHAGEFVADVVCNSPLTAIQQIEGEIQRQLDGWKKRRFSEKRREYRSTSRPHLEVAI